MSTLADAVPINNSGTTGSARFDRLTSAGVTVALVAVLALMFAAMVFPALTGRTPMTVLTGSMEPSLPPGHIVVYSPVDPAILVPGDVIAYQPDSDVSGGMPITHRVIAVGSPGGRVIVQGDASPWPDDPVRPGQIIGKMDYYIPYAGYLKVVAFDLGLGAITPLLSGALLIYWLWLVIGGILPKLRRRAARREA